MAISFSRPDPASPAAVGSAAFPTSRRGFDQGEVRDFLRMVAAELARLQERERFLESELRGMQTRGMSAPGRLDEETVTTLLGEEAARVLSTARDASAQIRERAEESATRLVKDAAEDASRIRESAMVEAARIHEDAAHDAEQEVEMAKQQGRDMVVEAREYREKVLSELSRRRDAARSQIEQLLHGRDRLLNAFERARLASEDVLAGLTDAHDEPEFIVDLAPTTGPVPIINPAHPSVKAYDQDAPEVAVPAEPVVTLTAAPVYDFEEDVVVETVETGKSIAEVIEAAVEEIVDDETPVVDYEHPVHVPTEVVEITTTVEVSDEVVALEEDVVEEEQQTNVVSLFGRGRKPADLPEIVDEEVVVETTTPAEVSADEIISAEVLAELKAELAAEKAAEEAAKAEARATAKEASPASSGADDIFAKLRASSTAAVAAKATESQPEKAEAKVADKPAKKFEAPKPKTPVVKADPQLFEARDEVLAPLVAAMSRKLKRVLADEQNDVLQHLRGKRSSLEIESFLGTVEEHAQRYAASVTEETMAAASSGAKSVKHAGGSSRRVTQKAIGAHVVSTIAQGLVAGFREDTRIAIGEAEGDRDILTGLMRDVYRKWKLDDIDSHVDDIACSAYSKGGFLSLEPGSQVMWMVDPNTKCCSECEDNALGGAVTRGDNFPTGHNHPPAHPGCRCLVGPNQD